MSLARLVAATRPSFQSGCSWATRPHAVKQTAVALAAGHSSGPSAKAGGARYLQHAAAWHGDATWHREDREFRGPEMNVVHHPDDPNSAAIHEQSLSNVEALGLSTADEVEVDRKTDMGWVDPATHKYNKKRTTGRSSLSHEVAAFLSRVDQPFADEDLVAVAITHISWKNRKATTTDDGEEEVEFVTPAVHNSRLHVIGHAATISALTEFMYMRYPKMSGSQIKQLCFRLGGPEVMARAAVNVGYHHLLRCNSTAIKDPANPQSQGIISDSFAAFIGAIWMDQGAASAHQFALDMILPLLDETDPKTFLDFVSFPKNTLKNLLRSEGNVAEALPTYEILAETGRKTHNPTFLVGVFSEERKLGEAASYSIKTAEDEAARAALRAHFGETQDSYEFPSRWGDYSAAEVDQFIRETQDPPPAAE